MITFCTVTNAGYLSYVDNLIASCRKAEVTWNLVVLCMDDASAAHCKEKGYLFYRCNLEANSEFQDWNATKEFNTVVFQKLDCLREFMEANPSTTYCVYLDGDIVVFKDFLHRLDEYFQFDIVFQCDQQGNACSNVFQCPYMCTGFMLLKNTHEVRDALHYQKHIPDIHQYSTDQHYLNAFVRQKKMRVATLPKLLFPNGSQRDCVSSVACLLHYNYLVGHEKQKEMKARGHWYVEENQTDK
jgi:hypothetical protein